ncbi:MAG: hypothetical protein JJU46_00750 [Balneolaceae bacterium]|nr:hypothetical protein [Balneolaceae bacterium]MCH8547311.1 hypothetical protein [Balneolaceae bacterium]
METDAAIFEVVAVVLAIPMSYFLSRIVKHYSKPGYRNEIDSDFLREWNGKPEDEYYAWIRLLRRYRKQDSPKEHYSHIKMKISMLSRRDMLSGMSVTEKGDVVEASGIKKKPDSEKPLDGNL